MSLPPRTPPRQRIQTLKTAPCIRAERRRKMLEWRQSHSSQKRLHKIKPTNLFGTPKRELGKEVDIFLTSHEKNVARPEALWKTRTFCRGRTNSFCASMADNSSTCALDDTNVSQSNGVPMSMQARFEVGKKRQRSNNHSFTPNTDTTHASSAVLQNTPQRSNVLMHKLRKRAQKSRLQDVLFDAGDDVAINIS